MGFTPMLLTVLLVSVAAAAPAAEVAWEGTLTVDVVGLGPLEVEGMGIATTSGIGTSLGTLQLRGGITGGDSLPVTGSDLSSVRLTAELGTGTLGPFWPAQPLTARELSVRGNVKLCLIFGCGFHIPLPLDLASGQSGLGVARQGCRLRLDDPLETPLESSIFDPRVGGEFRENFHPTGVVGIFPLISLVDPHSARALRVG